MSLNCFILLTGLVVNLNKQAPDAKNISYYMYINKIIPVTNL